jgi:hypothetical protein
MQISTICALFCFKSAWTKPWLKSRAHRPTFIFWKMKQRTLERTANRRPKIGARGRPVMLRLAINLYSGRVDTSPAAVDTKLEISFVLSGYSWKEVCWGGSQQAVSGRIGKKRERENRRRLGTEASPIPSQSGWRTVRDDLQWLS